MADSRVVRMACDCNRGNRIISQSKTLPGLAMKTLLACIAALGAAGLVHAHPLVIEESSRIAPPPGVDALSGDAALDGNDAVAVSNYSYLDAGGEDYITITSAWLYRRSGT